MTLRDKAIGFRIIVEIERIEEKTESGIVIGTADQIDTAQRGCDIGTVVSVGAAAFKLDRFGNTAWCKPGDKIRFKQYAGHAFREKDHLGRSLGPYYQVINDDDVLTIIEEKAHE